MSSVRWIQRGDGVPKNKDLQKPGVRNIVQCAQHNAANVSFSAIFPPTFTFPILSAMFTGTCVPPKPLSPRFGATHVRSAHDCEIRLCREAHEKFDCLIVFQVAQSNFSP